jgi:hypothetical protein
VNDIGKVLAEDDNLKPTAVLPIIFAKLEKKYDLVQRSPQMDNAIVKLIKLRRQYRASRETRDLMYRAYDHTLAGMLKPGPVPRKIKTPACVGAERELLRALTIYDGALKDYQRCLNGSNFQVNVEMQGLDGFLGGSTADIPTTSASGNCNAQRRALKQAVSAVNRAAAVANQACKGK